MQRFVYDQHEMLVAWAEERIQDCKFRDDAKAIGQEEDGVITAVVVFDTFATNNCFVHVAAGARRWITPEFATLVMAFPFIQCGLPRISCIVSVDNRPSRVLTRWFGWKQEGLIRKGSPSGEDMLLFGMLREECRWLPVPIFSPRGESPIRRSAAAHDVRAST
jgi:RimJ/RimL family protein N-acetyltransferase